MHALFPCRGGIAITRKKLKQNVPIYRQLEEILEAEISSERLEPGTRLPSERQICELYGVSVTPVRRALQSLVARGLIRRRRGSGSFVASRPSAAGPITIVFHKWLKLASDPVYGELLGGIVDGAGASRRSLVIEQLRERSPSPADLEALAGRIRASSTGGILFMGAPEVDLVGRLAAEAPLVQVGHHLGDAQWNYVGSDVPGAVRLAAEELQGSGAGPIAYFDGLGAGTDESGVRGVTESQKLAAYLAWCREGGFDVIRTAADTELLRLAAEEHSRSRLLGIIAHESGTGLRLIEAARDVGMRPGRDFLLVAFDNGGRGETTTPRMSAVKTFSRRMGERAVEVLEGLAAGGDAVRETMAAAVVRRETCGLTSHAAR